MATANGFSIKADRPLPQGAYWDRTIAEELARSNGIWPLTADHWKVIDFIRKYYLEHGDGPTAHKIYRATGFRLQHLFELFPGAITWNAHCIAGVPYPGKVSVKVRPDKVSETRLEPQMKEESGTGQEVPSGIFSKPKRLWQLAGNSAVQWAMALVVAISSAAMIFAILKPFEFMESRTTVPMTRIEATAGKGVVEVPLDLVKKNKLVSFEYKRMDGPVPLLAYVTPSGNIVTAVGLSEPCNSTSFHLEGNEIVCNLCLTRWKLETLEAVKGNCTKYPPEAVVHTIHDGRLAIREVDVQYWKPRPV